MYRLGVGWLRLVGSLKLQVSFTKEPYKICDILQKRRIILRSLLIVATPYHTHIHTRRSDLFDFLITVIGVLEVFLLPRYNLELGLGSLRQFRSYVYIKGHVTRNGTSKLHELNIHIYVYMYIIYINNGTSNLQRDTSIARTEYTYIYIYIYICIYINIWAL